MLPPAPDPNLLPIPWLLISAFPPPPTTLEAHSLPLPCSARRTPDQFLQHADFYTVPSLRWGCISKKETRMVVGPMTLAGVAGRYLKWCGEGGAGSTQYDHLLSRRLYLPCQAALLSSVLFITSWFLYSDHGPAYVYRTSIRRHLRRTSGQSPDTFSLLFLPCPPGHPSPHAPLTYSTSFHSFTISTTLPAFLPSPSLTLFP